MKLRAAAPLILFVLASLTSACGKDDPAPAKRSPEELLRDDLAELQVIDDSAMRRFDLHYYPQKLTEAFGGPTREDVNRFLTERLKYFFTWKQVQTARVTPDRFVHDRWMRDPGNPGEDEGSGDGDSSGVGAMNIGAGLWFQGILDRVSVTLFIGDQQIPIDSPRAGIMALGPAYVDELTSSDGGKTVKLPVAFRHSILIHEARHSDCTGGTTQADLDLLRNAQSMDDFVTKYKKKACGHLHSRCPVDHELAGQLACDEHAWGAYTYGAIFAHAQVHAAATETDYQIMRMFHADMKSRIALGYEKHLSGELGRPDLRSVSVTD